MGEIDRCSRKTVNGIFTLGSRRLRIVGENYVVGQIETDAINDSRHRAARQLFDADGLL